MAFLLKVFSGSERLKEKQRSAARVNEAFQAELNDVQTKLEVENYELQMLVEMIYDSSYPESQKFLKQPSKDRLYAHKETISSLLFGLAAQGVSVAPLILTHFQKHGCDAIADTLLTLLDLVRPLLASRDVPEFTSDDILDAIDVQWHSSVRSSPAFGSLRGSTTASPLQSPRVSFSNLSPRQSFSNLSPRRSFSNLSPRESVSSPVSPFQTHAYSLTQSFSFSPPSETVLEGVRAAPVPRRSLSSQYPALEVHGERLQPLVEHEEEITTGNLRMQDDKDETFSTGISPVLHSSSSTVEREFGKGLSINIPRSSASFEVKAANEDQSVGMIEVADAEPRREFSHEQFDKSVGDVNVEVLSEGFSRGTAEDILESESVPSCDSSNHEVSEKDIVASLPTKGQLHVEDSEHTVGDQGVQHEPMLEFSQEPLDNSVGDVDAEDQSEGFSRDTAEDILESESAPSCDSSTHEVSEKEIEALPTISSLHVEEPEQTLGKELNSTDNSLTISEERMEEDPVGVVKMVDMPTPPETQLQSDKEVEESKGSSSENTQLYESALDPENVAVAVIDGPEVGGESLDVLELSSSMESCEHNVQEQLVSFGESHNEGDIIVVPSSSSLLQGTTSESSIVLDDGAAASLHEESSQEELGPRSLSEKSTSIQGLEYSGDPKDDTQNEMDKAEELFPITNNETSDKAVDSVEEDEAMEGVEKGGAIEGVKEDGATMEGVEEDGAVEGVEKDGAITEGVEEDGATEGVEKDGAITEGVEEDGAVEGVEKDGAILEEVDGLMEGVGANPSESVPIQDNEPSFSLFEDPNEEYLVEKSGVGEAEFHELSDPRSIAQSGTDVVSQSSFSDHYDGEVTTEPSSDDEISSSDDEETVSVEKKNQYGQNGEYLSSEESEHAGNPELEQYGAALHSPSYNLVTFDLTKLLSRDENQDIEVGAVVDESTSRERERLCSDVTLGRASEEADLAENETNFSHSDAGLVESGASLQSVVDVPMKPESNEAELFVGALSQRNEPPRNDSEAFSRSEEFGNSSAAENQFAVAGDNVVNICGENHSQDEEKNLASTTDSAKREDRNLEAEILGSGGITSNANHSVEDLDDLEVMASHSQQVDEEGASSNQYGLNLADGEDEMSATNQSVSTKSEEENGLKEGSTCNSLNLSPTIDEEHRNSISDQVDGGRDTDEGISANVVHFMDKTEVNDDFQPKNVTQPCPCEESPIGSVSASELESQSVENSEQEGVVHSPDQHDHLSLGGDGASVGHGHVEGKPADEEKDLVDEVILSCPGEGPDTKQDLNYEESSQENGICDLSTDLHVNETSFPSEDHGHDKTKLDEENDFVVISLRQDSKQGLTCEESSQENGTFGVCAPTITDVLIHPSQDREVIKREMPKLSDHDFRSSKDLDMSTHDETEKDLDVESREGCNGIHTKNQVEKRFVLKSEEPGMKEPKNIKKEKDVELVTGSATYGVFLHNTKFLDSPGTFVRALTAPVNMARHVETEPERHSIRDSLICTPASNSDGSSRTHKNGRRRRYSFLRTCCCSCFSKPAAL